MSKTSELRALELSEKRWSEHLRSVRRGLVLLARLQNGEKLQAEEAAFVAESRRRLREVADAIEGVLGK